MHSGFKRCMAAGLAALMSAVMLSVPAAAVAEDAALTELNRNAVDVLDSMPLRRSSISADAQIDFSLKDASAAPGQMVAVSAVIGNNPGYENASVSISFPKELKMEAPIGAGTAIVVNDTLFPEAAAAALVLPFGTNAVNYCQEKSYSTENGVLFDIFFRLPEDAVPGTVYEISLAETSFWQNDNVIPVAAKNAKITVTDPPPKPKAKLLFETANNQSVFWSEQQDAELDLSALSVKLRIEEDGVLREDFSAEVGKAFAAETGKLSELKQLPKDSGELTQQVPLVLKDASVLEEALKGTPYEGLTAEQGIQNGYQDSALSVTVGLVLRCDSDLDGKVGLNDVQEALRFYSLRMLGGYDDEKILDADSPYLNNWKNEKKAKYPYSFRSMDAADGNGAVGLEDVLYILKYYAYYVIGQYPVTTEPVPATTTLPESGTRPFAATETTAVTGSTDVSVSVTTLTEGTHSGTETTLTTVYKGLDISFWQGEVDFQKIKDETDIDFFIIRAGMGRFLDQEDKKFRTYYDSLKALDFKVGAYWYSYAMTPEAARIEANVCLQVLGDRKFEYPIVLDIEEPAVFTLPPEVIGSIITAFCDEIEKGGCYAMVYCSPFWYNQYVPPAVRQRYDLWIAHWDVAQPAYYENYGMWQYHVGPFTGFTCDVDHDYSYRDYEEIIKRKHLNGY
ncbi:MAG: hypothetical protein IKQ91_05840 [Oscillospiraceae bacterium]|nr:hypothetical protein [Oscillospiraceae bacterium]